MFWSSGCRFCVVWMGGNVDGMVGNGEERGMKGSRKPRCEENGWFGVVVGSGPICKWSAMLKMVGHVEIHFNNVVMWGGS